MRIGRDGIAIIDPFAEQGLKIVASPVLAKQRMIKRERKWYHRKRYQPERRFDISYEPVMEIDHLTECYRLGDTLFVHPAMYEKIKNGPPNHFSMGSTYRPLVDAVENESVRDQMRFYADVLDGITARAKNKSIVGINTDVV